MFYCEEDRVKNDWPASLFRSYGRCEMCGQTEECYDVPSSSLPDPIVKEEKPMTGKIESKSFIIRNHTALANYTLEFCQHLLTLGKLEDFTITVEKERDGNGFWHRLIATRKS